LRSFFESKSARIFRGRVIISSDKLRLPAYRNDLATSFRSEAVGSM
jgi:hypothetical protein